MLRVVVNTKTYTNFLRKALMRLESTDKMWCKTHSCDSVLLRWFLGISRQFTHTHIQTHFVDQCKQCSGFKLHLKSNNKHTVCSVLNKVLVPRSDRHFDDSDLRFSSVNGMIVTSTLHALCYICMYIYICLITRSGQTSRFNVWPSISTTTTVPHLRSSRTNCALQLAGP